MSYPCRTIGETSDHTPYVECTWASGLVAANPAGRGINGCPFPATAAEREALRVAGGGSDDAGANLSQLADGWKRRYGHDPDRSYVGGGTWTAITNAMAAGLWVVVQGYYNTLPLHYRRFQPSGTFGHAACVGKNDATTAWWIDPLGPDGYGGEPIPLAALQHFCASLAFRMLAPTGSWSRSLYGHSVVATVDGLNVRSGPATTYSVVAKLAKGTRISTNRITMRGGSYAIGTIHHADWLGYLRNGVQVWIARGYTSLLS